MTAADMQAHAVTEAIARFATKTALSDAPAELWELARRGIVDTVGVTIAARVDPTLAILMDAQSGERAAGPSTILTTGEQTSPAQAAFINGVAGHALDFDDVIYPIYGHPSVVLLPAALAVAESRGASGRELLEAYIVGVQVACAIGNGMSIRGHYSHGWHSTATIGVLAAAATCARLLELDTERTRRALGIAASMASGSRQNFGTMTKPLHAGLAARDGVTAATLAKGGFTADDRQLEAPMGFFAMYGVDVQLELLLQTLHGPWALEKDGLEVKKYPCCYNTHRTADTTLRMRGEHQLDGTGIDSVRLTVEPGGLDPLIHHRPQTGLQAKFSAEYVIAAGLVDGNVSLASFTDERVQRPAIQELIERITVHESDVPPFGPEEWTQAYAVINIETCDGDTMQDRTDVPRGAPGKPLGREELEAKFTDCVDASGTGWKARAILDELWSIDSREALGSFASLPPEPLGSR